LISLALRIISKLASIPFTDVSGSYQASNMALFELPNITQPLRSLPSISPAGIITALFFFAITIDGLRMFVYREWIRLAFTIACFCKHSNPYAESQVLMKKQ
jgi:hypothetical protein